MSLKKLFQKVSAAAAGCLLALGALLPARAAGAEAEANEKTEQFEVSTYAYSKADNPYSRALTVPWRIYDSGSVAAQRLYQLNYLALIPSPVAGQSPVKQGSVPLNAFLYRAKDTQGSSLVTYCLESGKNQPGTRLAVPGSAGQVVNEPARLDYQPEKLDAGLYAVLRSGYPYRQDYTVEQNGTSRPAEKWEMEWATSLAVYLQTKKHYNPRGDELFLGKATLTAAEPGKAAVEITDKSVHPDASCFYVFYKKQVDGKTHYFILENGQEYVNQAVEKDVTEQLSKYRSKYSYTDSSTGTVYTYSWAESGAHAMVFQEKVFSGEHFTNPDPRIGELFVEPSPGYTTQQAVSISQIATRILENAKELKTRDTLSLTVKADPKTRSGKINPSGEGIEVSVQARLEADWASVPDSVRNRYSSLEDVDLLLILKRQQADGSWQELARTTAKNNGSTRVFKGISSRVSAVNRQADEKVHFKVEAYALGYEIPTDICYASVSQSDTTNSGTPDAVDLQRMYVAETVDINNEKETALELAENVSLTVSKTDEAGEPLAGAQFSLYEVTDKGDVLLEEAESDESGQVLFTENLDTGRYALVETKAPAGYSLACAGTDKQVRVDIEVGDDYKPKFLLNAEKTCLKSTDIENPKMTMATDAETGQTIRRVGFSLKNKAFPSFAFIKEDAAGNPLSGASYMVNRATLSSGEDGLENKTERLTTGKDGRLSSSQIQAMNAGPKDGYAYRGVAIHEKSAPAGYRINSNVLYMFIKANGTPVFYVQPEGKDARLVSCDDKETMIEQYGLYIEQRGNTYIAHAINKADHISIRKTDALSQAALPGAEFEICKKSGETVIEKAVTNADGIYTFDGSALEAGEYFIRETKAPAGYVLDSTPVAFVITPSGTLEGVEDNVLVIENTPAKTVVLHKADLTGGQPLEGAEIQIFQVVNGKRTPLASAGENGKVSTDAKGDITLTDLAPGSYVFKETAAPYGYSLTETEFTFEIGKEGTVVSSAPVENDTITFTNARKTFTLYKTDDRNAPLAGALIEIRSSTGEKVAEKATDAKGEAVFDVRDFAAGTYTFQETKAPTGYRLNASVHTFSLDAAGNIQQDKAALTLVNHPTEVILLKVDADDGIPLAGAVFEIRTAGGQQPSAIAMASQSDEQGRFVIRGLAPGRYTFTEIRAPQGYAASAKEQSFTVAEDGSVSGQTTMVNTRASAVIEKLDAETSAGIAGVQFDLIRTDDQKVVRQFTTNTAGQAVFNPLESTLGAGEYILRETKQAAGYLPEMKEIAFSIDANGILLISKGSNSTAKESVLTVTNTPSVVRFVKTGSAKGEKAAPLAGAVFELYRLEDAKRVLVKEAGASGRLTSGADGSVVLKRMPDGDYILKEIRPAAGYVLSGNGETAFSIHNGKGPYISGTLQENAEIYNEARIEKIRKVDAENGAGLEGAVFRLAARASQAEIVLDATDEKGYASIDMRLLAPGVWDIYEEAAPKGYGKAQGAVGSLTVLADLSLQKEEGKTLSIANHISEVIFEKIDRQTGQALDGARFEVRNDKGEVVNNASNTTAASGTGLTVIRGLEPGTYTFKEIQAPAGYACSDEEGTFTIHEDGSATGSFGQKEGLKIENEALQGIIRKQAEDGTPLSKAVFELYKDGEIYLYPKPIETGEDGCFAFDMRLLPAGHYSLKEIEAPLGYALSEEEIPFVVTENRQLIDLQGREVVIVNYSNGAILHKYDAVHADPVPGAEISVYALKTKEGKTERTLWQSGTTDANGDIVLTDIPAGQYVFEETTAPFGYQKMTSEIGFTVHEDGTIETQCDHAGNTIRFANTPQEVVIHKQDVSNSAPVAGAEISIVHEDGTGQSEVTDENGDITLYVRALKPGQYTITETRAPQGFMISSETWTFTVAEDGTVSYDEDLLISDAPTSLQILKTDEDGNSLTGAEFEIISLDDPAREVHKVCVDENGRAELLYLPAGSYSLKETKAPEGFVLDETDYPFEISDQTPTKLTLVNKAEKPEPQPEPLVLHKKDLVNSAPVEGAQISIYTLGEGDIRTAVHTGKTDENGDITLTALMPGRYVFEETAAPFGYEKMTQEIPFTVLEDGTVETEAAHSGRTIEFENRPVPVVIHKQDLVSSAPLKGAEIEIRYPDGSTVRQETDVNGDITLYVRDLKPGRYAALETAAPNGYQLSREEFVFDVDENGQVDFDRELIIRDAPTELTIEKTDTSGNPLSGALFALYTEDGKPVAMPESWGATGEDGRIEAKGLPFGSYILKEVFAPAGYIKGEDIAFEISQEKGDVVLKVENRKEPEKKPDEPQMDVILHKYDLTFSQPVKGAQIHVWKEKDDGSREDILKGKTDENGDITLRNLEPGAYGFKETLAPYGYLPAETEFSFRLEEDGSLESTLVKSGNTLMFANTPESIVIHKEDLTDSSPVENAVISITDENGETLDLTTDKDGNITLYVKDLKPGRYLAKETVAPDGYLISEDTFEFTITADGKAEYDQDLIIRDAPTEISVEKTDVQGRPLAGARFGIFSEEGTALLYELITNAQGKASVTHVPHGRYYVQEIEAPEGYRLDDTKTLVEITGQSGRYIHRAVNKLLEDKQPQTPEEPDSPDQPVEEKPAERVETGDAVHSAGAAVLLIVGMCTAAFRQYQKKRREENKKQ